MTDHEVVRWVLENTTIRWVCGGGHDAPFAYTAGYWKRGLPELVVIGLNDHASTTMLNMYGARQRHTEKPWRVGDIDTDMYTLPTKFGAVAPAWVKENMTLSFERAYPHGRPPLMDITANLPVVQVLWPDRRGIFPDEKGFSTEFSGQTLLA